MRTKGVINVDEAYDAARRLRGHVVVSYEPGSSNYDMTLVLDFLAAVHSDIKKLEAELERLHGTIERWAAARRVMMAGSAEGKPWSSESIAALGLAENALMAILGKGLPR